MFPSDLWGENQLLIFSLLLPLRLSAEIDHKFLPKNTLVTEPFQQFGRTRDLAQGGRANR